jgi:hypothetical protein
MAESFVDTFKTELIRDPRLEDTVTARARDRRIRRVAKGACPPESCGGPWGHADLKAILADPSHEQHQEMLDWLGLDNSSAFDPHAVTTDQIAEEVALNGASR